jgi:hypothetical protein
VVPSAITSGWPLAGDDQERREDGYAFSEHHFPENEIDSISDR